MSFLLRMANWLARRGWPRLAMTVGRYVLSRRPSIPGIFHGAVDIALAAGGRAQAERLCRERLAVDDQDHHALLRLGHLMLDDGRGAEAAGYFRRLDGLDGRHDAVTEVFAKQHLDIARASRGETYFRWLDDVRVDTAYWTIMRDGVIYNDDVHAKNLVTSPFIRGRVSADGATVIATLPLPQTEVIAECILVGGDENYSHWLFRNMLKLSTLDRAGLLYRYPWLVNSDLRGYQIEYIHLLGQQTGRLIRVERNTVVTCKRLLVPALHVSTRAVSHGVQWIRERMAHLCVAPAQATRRLFVSRRDVGRRSLLNEDELCEALAPLGFVRTVPGDLSVAEQIATFSSARIIVAAHGAGLTNMIFAPPGTAIIELTSTAIEHMNLFRKLARSTQQQIITIRSEDYPVPAHEAGVNTDYRVDPQSVLRAVESAL